MEKLTDKENKCMNKSKKRVSWNLLFCYLLILLAPSLSTVVTYNMARNAMVDNQKERITSTLSQVNSSFNQEIKMAQNVGYYVSREKRLVNYLSRVKGKDASQQFYEQYTIANNYPNYSLMNQVIKNVYILIADSEYVIRIPQVVPKNDRGAATLDGFPLYSYERFQEFYDKQDKSQTLFYYEENPGNGSLLLPCQMVYPGIQEQECAIIVELDWGKIVKMMQPVLGGNAGMVALLDEKGNILESCRIYENSFQENFLVDQNFYTLKNTKKGDNISYFQVNCGYNGWKLAAAIPNEVLYQRIGIIRYISVALCVTAILIGVLTCLGYWYRRKGIVEECCSLQERINKTQIDGKGFWKNFGTFLTQVDHLHNTVEKQELMLKQAVLRKILYGNYKSEEEVLESAAAVQFPLDDKSYSVVTVELEDPFQAESDININRDTFLGAVNELIHETLPWNIWIYRVSELSCVLLVHEKTDINREELKNDLNKLNFELHSRLNVKGYMGISGIAEEIVDIPKQYEIASRVCEYARYQGICVPLLPEDMPNEKIIEQPMFFSIDMEMKLISLLKSGNVQQIEEIIAQIKELYLYQGIDSYIYRHTVEILRGCLFRSIPSENESPRSRELSAAASKAHSAGEIFAMMRKVGVFWEEAAREREECQVCIDKQKVSDYIEENYGDPTLNLSVLAEWLGEPERRIYNDFKVCFGMSFSSYLEQRRLACACELLKKGAAVKDIAEQVGYSSDYSFRRAFKRAFGVSPSDFKKCQSVSV